MVFAPWLIVAVYPELMVIEATLTAMSMVQLPLSRKRGLAPPSKKTLSPAPGTDDPPKPPELDDQFNVLLQLPARSPTQ
jgi:hypothetical protein